MLRTVFTQSPCQVLGHKCLSYRRGRQMSKPRIKIHIYKYSELRQHKGGIPGVQGRQRVFSEEVLLKVLFQGQLRHSYAPTLIQPCFHLHFSFTSISPLIAFKCSAWISYSMVDKNTYHQTLATTHSNSVLVFL